MLCLGTKIWVFGRGFLHLQSTCFLDSLRIFGKDALIESLLSLRDSVVCCSDIEINKEFKDVLFDLKIVWRGFENGAGERHAQSLFFRLFQIFKS